MNLEPDIIYEDNNLVVINKPAGLAVHSAGQRPELTLADWLVGRFPQMVEVGEPARLADGRLVARPGIVHRLDRDTSGVMVVVKNQETFFYLKEQFKKRLVKKTYLAIVTGYFAEPDGEKVIDLPIGRSKTDPRLRVASPKATSTLRPARTLFRVLETLGDYSYIEAHPETGRTHQLRAHFKAIQHPIACDYLYAKGKICPKGLIRQALHAYKLEIFLSDKERKEFIIPPPIDFQTALENLRRAC